MKIATLVLSCGRWDLLSKSLESYCRSMPVPTNIIIFDDSLSKLGQAVALDKLVDLGWQTDADFFMMLEDDWVFEPNSDWYWLSMQLLQCPEVMLIGLSLTEQLRPYMPEGELNGVKIRWHNPWRLSESHGYWNGWISSPHLMRRDDFMNLPKFSNYIAEEKFDQEAWRPLYDLGRRSVWLDHQYVHHIGGGRSLFPTGDKLSPEVRTWLRSHT